MTVAFENVRDECNLGNVKQHLKFVRWSRTAFFEEAGHRGTAKICAWIELSAQNIKAALWESYSSLVHISFLISLSTHVPVCNSPLSLYKVGRGREGGLKCQRSRGLAFCTRCLVKGYVLPSRPLWGKKKKSNLLCKAIILFTSRCMYKEWQGEDGNVREMSDACWLCPVYFSNWNVHSGEEGPGQGDCGGPRSNLLMTFNTTSASVLWKD